MPSADVAAGCAYVDLDADISVVIKSTHNDWGELVICSAEPQPFVKSRSRNMQSVQLLPYRPAVAPSSFGAVRPIDEWWVAAASLIGTAQLPARVAAATQDKQKLAARAVGLLGAASSQHMASSGRREADSRE